MPKYSPDDMVTTAQAAAALRRGIKGVRGLMARGELTPAVKFPGKTGGYLFRVADVQALVERQSDSDQAAS